MKNQHRKVSRGKGQIMGKAESLANFVQEIVLHTRVWAWQKQQLNNGSALTSDGLNMEASKHQA